jgi:hypothetical protein
LKSGSLDVQPAGLFGLCSSFLGGDEVELTLLFSFDGKGGNSFGWPHGEAVCIWVCKRMRTPVDVEGERHVLCGSFRRRAEACDMTRVESMVFVEDWRKTRLPSVLDTRLKGECHRYFEKHCRFLVVAWKRVNIVVELLYHLGNKDRA